MGAAKPEWGMKKGVDKKKEEQTTDRKIGIDADKGKSVHIEINVEPFRANESSATKHFTLADDMSPLKNKTCVAKQGATASTEKHNNQHLFDISALKNVHDTNKT